MQKGIKKELFTLRELVEKYDISMSRLKKATMNNAFPFYKQGKIFVKETDFTSWLTANRIESASEAVSRAKIPT